MDQVGRWLCVVKYVSRMHATRHLSKPLSNIKTVLNRYNRHRSCQIFASSDMSTKAMKLLIVSHPSTPELSVLQKLPSTVEIVRVGKTLQDFGDLTDEQWASVTVLLSCGVGANAAKREDIMQIWPKLVNLKWMHSASAGLEHLLFPEMVEGPVVLTNAKGVYSNSLAEFALMACKFFAMDGFRLLKAKKERKWAPYDVEELRGKVLGVVGFGDIGMACARLAKAFQMRVVALRRNTQLTEEEAQIVERIHSPDQICDLMAGSDYVVVSTPYTPATHGLVSAAAIQAMKPNAVLVNVGRGKCIDEPALISALSERRIRGAALDVYATEPLPEDSPLWEMDNVFMSPHCADRTSDFQFHTMEFFLQNVDRFLGGQPLLNVCDKARGY